MSADYASIVLSALTEAADAHKRCPTNPELCSLTGMGSVSGPVAVMDRLVRKGLINVERYQTGREVTICATGRKTAYYGTRQPHWRDRSDITARPRRHHASYENRACAPVDDDCLPPVVVRDPCPRCGTRQDIGCEHHRAPLSMGAF